jgi:hypothetical protein
MSPVDVGIFEGTPIVNDRFLTFVRSGKCSYMRSDLKRLTSNSANLSLRKRGTEPGDPGRSAEVEVDILILATGYKRPSIDFLPQDLFPDDYQRPDLYLQNFSVEDWSVLMTNSAYMNAVGEISCHSSESRLLILRERYSVSKVHQA